MRKVLLGCICAVSLLAACKKSETLYSPTLSEYFPLQVGKYIIYRLDSTVLTPFGAALTTHSYRAKDVVDAEYTDNLGRKAYRIFRYITDTNGVAVYQPAATYSAVYNGTDWVEYVDNNLRFMKLRWPVREATQWKGNSLFVDAYGGTSNPNAAYYADWTYRYDSLFVPYTIFGKTYDSTVKVFQQDVTEPEGPISPLYYQQRNYSVERYAKGIGLIEKTFLHYIWQPQTNSTPARFQDESYGIRLRIIEHN